LVTKSWARLSGVRHLGFRIRTQIAIAVFKEYSLVLRFCVRIRNARWQTPDNRAQLFVTKRRTHLRKNFEKCGLLLICSVNQFKWMKSIFWLITHFFKVALMILWYPNYKNSIYVYINFYKVISIFRTCYSNELHCDNYEGINEIKEFHDTSVKTIDLLS
jgi:hypothetical protein